LPHLPSAGEDDDPDLCITEHRKLLCLLDEATSSFGKGYLPCGGVLDPLYLNLSTSHVSQTLPQFPSTLSFSLNPYTHYHIKKQVKPNFYIYVYVNQLFEFFYLPISTENKQRF